MQKSNVSIKKSGHFPTAQEIDNSLKKSFQTVLSGVAEATAQKLSTEFGPRLANKSQNSFKANQTPDGVVVTPSNPEQTTELSRIEFGDGNTHPGGFVQRANAQAHVALPSLLKKIQRDAKKNVFGA